MGNIVEELVREEKGYMKVESLISSGSERQQKKKAQEMIIGIQEQLSKLLLEQKLTETKLKRLNEKIKMTEAFKAVKLLKANIKTAKKDTEKLALMLMGMKKLAKELGIELPNIKALLED